MNTKILIITMLCPLLPIPQILYPSFWIHHINALSYDDLLLVPVLLVSEIPHAIGTVFPLMGEGIIPSLHCAEMLKENLNDIEAYEQRVLEKFSSYTDIYKIIKLKMEDKISVFSMLKYSGILWNLYRTMKSEEERFGLEVRIRDLMAIMLAQRGN